MKTLILPFVLVALLTAEIQFFFPGHAAAAPAPAADEVNYVRRLPHPDDFASNQAAPDGATVEKIVQTGGEVTVTYAFSDGRIRVVSYRLLPSSGATGDSASVALAPATVPPPSDDSPAPAVPVNNPLPAPINNYYSGPSYTIVYQQPAPAAAEPSPDYLNTYQPPAPDISSTSQYHPVAAPPPAPVYSDPSPTYSPAVHPQPAPARTPLPGYGYVGYPAYPVVIVRADVNHAPTPRGGVRGGSNVVNPRPAGRGQPVAKAAVSKVPASMNWINTR